MELDLVRKKMEAIPDFPPNLKTLVEHLLISHHGQYEFGSPKLPMFREAVLFHYLDDLDSKMGAMRATLSSGRGEGVWTERNAALGRRLLRVEKFLEASPSMQAGPDSIGAGSGDPIQLRFEAAAGREEED